MKKEGLILLMLLALIALPSVSAAHFITGFVNNSLSGTSANDYTITLWNPANGINDNLTDIIGTTGNSGADNIYLIDCELLQTPCVVGDTLNSKVFNNGSNYVTETSSLTVTGFGFDTMPSLTLNSIPNVTLLSPLNYANLSSSEINLSCIANDLDSNLANITLYGNWSNNWHANETISISGSTNTTNFTKTIDEGIYKYSCLATDNLSISAFAEENFTFTIDLTSPTISSIELNLSGNICGTQENLRINCTTSDLLSGIENVIIQTSQPSGNINHTLSLLSGDTYYVDIELNETGIWNFNCIAQDHAGNIANLTSESLNIRPNNPDLTLNSNDIAFSNSTIENSPITINATIHNNGCTDANNLLVAFYEGDPDISAIQINGNKTISVPGLSNTTTNVTWSAKIGLTNIFVSADINNSFTENNETDNKANKTIEINAWQEFYGKVEIDKLLADQNNRNLSLWFNESILSGNIFIADTENNIDWNSLHAIGKNTSNENTTNDFSDIDTLLNMTDFSDSVSNTFTTDGNTPLSTENFFAYQKNISQVPIINSTNTTNFITGILWDTSDTSNDEFDTTDSEDLVFITKLNKDTQGAYGIYDYEIRIPVRLREYNATDTNDVFIYFDLN